MNLVEIQKNYRALNLENALLEENKQFTRMLYYAPLIEKQIFFDKKEKHYRENDPNMTIENYLENITPQAIIRFFVDRSQYNPKKGLWEKRMTLAWIGKFSNDPTTRFAWLHCPTKPNYEQVDRIFESVYKTTIENFPYLL
ncbi:MAG: hypothetical protein QW594_00585 [Candidatus Woesearchaeota archaeon]